MVSSAAEMLPELLQAAQHDAGIVAGASSRLAEQLGV